MGIQVFGASGTEHHQGGNALQEILQFVAGQDSSRNRIGFFGSSGPPSSPVTVNTYQDKTYPTNATGGAIAPPLVQLKYIGSASTVQVSGAWNASTAEVQMGSGTILIRFTEPDDGEVQTQNAYLEALKIASDIPAQNDPPDSVIVQAFETQHSFGISIDNGTWVRLSDGDGTGGNGGGSASNQLGLTDHTWLSRIHDYGVALSVSPTAAGQIKEFGFYIQVDYL